MTTGRARVARQRASRSIAVADMASATIEKETVVISAGVGATSAEAMANGIAPVVELGVEVGYSLPVSGSPVAIPTEFIRLRFDRDQAIEIFTQGIAAAQSLPETPPSGNVLLAQNMADVEKAAENMKRITEGQHGDPHGRG